MHPRIKKTVRNSEKFMAASVRFYLYQSNCVFGDCYSVDKMGHLLKLADEYDVQGVLDLCTKCLKDVPKSEENVVKILYLATDTVIASEDSRLDGVRDDCEILIKDMDLVNITAKSDFKKLSRDSMERVFVKRTERLETFIREIHPQLVGLVEYCLYLKLASSPSVITRCPQHFLSNKSYIGLLQRIRSCLVCRGMITQLVTSSISNDKQLGQTSCGMFGTSTAFGSTNANQTEAVKEHLYGGNCHFDEKLVSLLQDINKVVSLPDFFFGSPISSFGGFSAVPVGYSPTAQLGRKVKKGR